jgi:DtxR family Mn-dependent transcriptional regulator
VPHTVAIEDYAKAIYALERRGEGTVTTTALADRVGVTPRRPASSMVPTAVPWRSSGAWIALR